MFADRKKQDELKFPFHRHPGIASQDLIFIKENTLKLSEKDTSSDKQ